jgi:hypothetical protein
MCLFHGLAAKTQENKEEKRKREREREREISLHIDKHTRTVRTHIFLV